MAPSASILGYNVLVASDWLTAWADSLGGSSAMPNSASADIFNMSFGGLGSEGQPPPGERRAAVPPWGEQPARRTGRHLRQGRRANGFEACRSMPRAVNDEIGCLSANSDPINNLPYLIVVGGFNALGERAQLRTRSGPICGSRHQPGSSASLIRR